MAVNVSTYNQILGNLIRKILATTPINDVNTGSVLLTLLEAIASNDFENNVTILNVLELLNIDVLKDKDLEDRAADFSLSRNPALKASGQVTITDSSINKLSTGLYAVKPPPIAGSTVIYVNDASLWNAFGGTLYIGRGTSTFEGPVTYTSIVNSGTFYTINLASALQKDHLASETVVNGQGTTDRVIPAGTIVSIPANNQNPEIQYSTLRDAVIPAGENIVTGVDTVAIKSGSLGNAGINTIVNFASPPFSGAVVTNSTAFTNGADVESDVSLRARIKSYAQTLTRGTKQAILSSVIGLFDAAESKQVVSAVITEPTNANDPAILYIDDGTGFQPSYSGQPIDILVNSASGKETFFQLANFPLTRPQVVNTVDGPYELSDGMTFTVAVDGIEEEILFSASQFNNIASATLPEITVAINNQSTLFKARLDQQSSRLLIYPVDATAETIRVVNADDANAVLGFQINEVASLNLYENNTRLKEKLRAATLQSASYANWNVTSFGNLIISVDGTPQQDQTFSVADFGGTPFPSLLLSDWVAVFNTKFAGITASESPNGNMIIVSNKLGSESSLEIIGGSLIGNIFSDLPKSAVGQNSDFELSRESGNVKITNPLIEGSRLSCGTEDAKGSLTSFSTLTGTYDLSVDAFDRLAEMIIVSDANEVTPKVVAPQIGSTITISNQGSNVMRIMSSSLLTFANVLPLDFVYLVNRGDDDGSGTGPWLDILSCGLFKIIDKGGHTSAGVNTFIDVVNPYMVTGSYSVQSTEDIQAFSADKYPQLWKGSFLGSPSSATLQQVVDSINNNIIGVIASIANTNSIKITSTTEEDGSIAIPVSVANAKNLFVGGSTEIKGNPPLIANKAPSKDAITYFKKTASVNTNVFLGRYIYQDIEGSLTADAAPGIEGFDPYSEILESTGILNNTIVEPKDIVSTTYGNNKQLYRPIKHFLPGDQIGTQFREPKTIMNYSSGDEFQIVRPLELSSEDSMAFVIDNDPVNKTINVNMWRTGRVNSGSQMLSFLPTNNAFSANDIDNEPGIDFGTAEIWSTSTFGTDFSDYAAWFKARNWYATGGAGSGGAQMLIRAYQYGPTGEKIKFAIDYPDSPNQTNTTTATTSPSSTIFKYIFGSGAARTTNITSGSNFQVTSLGSDQYRYTWDAGVDLSAVQIGDIFSALSNSGISSYNGGQHSILAVNAASFYFDVYNPDAVLTSPGNAAVDQITTIADVVGSASIHDITTIADIAGSLNGDYFVLTDSQGTVAVWYDLNNAGSAPPSAGTNRYIKIPTVNTGDSANTVASKTAAILNNDPEFSATVLLNVITATNTIYGLRAAGNAGTSGFTVNQTSVGVNPVSLNGKYFIIYDANGSVAVWYDVDNQGTLEPVHGASRSIKVSTVISGDSANTVASKTAAVINADAQFSATSLGSNITVTNVSNGPRSTPQAGTSGFTTSQITGGTSATPETVVISSSVTIFPLANTSLTDITALLNETQYVNAVAVGNPALTITKATREEVYVPAGPSDYSQSLSFGHDPDPLSSDNELVNLYDSAGWVQTFQNANPNFTLKNSFVLEGVVPAIYSMDTCVNSDTSDLGEAFKLIPVTLYNLQHHFTQKPLSQLPIVSDVDFSNNFRRDQIKSLQLGSAGAVQVTGGRGNASSFQLLDQSLVTTDSGADYLKLDISAFPDTINVGDTVLLSNPTGVQRFSRLDAADTIDVARPTSTDSEYRFNPKQTFFNQYVKFAISDVSALYGRPAGIVWRWTHSDAGSQLTITSQANGLATPSPASEVAAGGSPAANIVIDIVDPGSVSTPLQFVATVIDVPTQADYITFETALGVTFAAWFSVDGNLTAPTGASYVAATNKIQVSVLSTDTPDELTNKLGAALVANVPFNNNFDMEQSQGASLSAVNEGDLIFAFGTLPGWDHTNMASGTGDELFAGLPIIAVNAGARYIDVVNPNGKVMSSTYIGATGTVHITPAPVIKWNLRHTANIEVVSVVVSSGSALITLNSAHNLNVGDTFILNDNNVVPTTPGSGIGTVVSITAFNQFTFATSSPDGTYTGGSIIDTAKTITRYRIEALGYNDMFRLRYIDGESPRFADCGVAIDDYIVLSGDTFSSNNNGRFRVLSVNNEAIIYMNPSGSEELNTTVPINNLGQSVNWLANSANVIGAAGAFKNTAVGHWVKKTNDPDSLYRQVAGYDTGNPVTATVMTLGEVYLGTTSISTGVRYDQLNDVNKGVKLLNIDDIAFYEGDSCADSDTLFVQNIVDPTWFSTANTGTFIINTNGTSSDYKPFVRISNRNGLVNTGISLNAAPGGLLITESANNKFYTIRQVVNIALSDLNTERRSVFVTPADRFNKFSNANNSTVSPIGKVGFGLNIAKGIDGYVYYTGLLRAVQRTVDGYEPDKVSFPGYKAAGGQIETLPPLILPFEVALKITTIEGFSLSDITNQIKSVILNYVASLGVGQDVILSEIIATVMGVRGVGAATFIDPVPSTERISIAFNEKAFLESDNISLSS